MQVYDTNQYIIRTAKQGSLLETLAANTTRQIIDSVKKQQQSFETTLSKGLKLQLKVVISKDYYPFSVYGNYNMTSKFMSLFRDKHNVNLVISSYDWPFPANQYEKLYYNLLKTIRHELEHYDQFKDKSVKDTLNYKSVNRNQKDVKQLSKDYIAYLLQPIEIEAWVAGFYQEAKKRRVDLSFVMEESINKIVDSLGKNGFNGAEIQQSRTNIINAWTQYAKTRYPDAKLNFQPVKPRFNQQDFMDAARALF